VSNHRSSIPKGDGTQELVTLETAKAVYLNVWNMECPDCALWLHDGLLKISGVLLVDVFYKQGVAVVIYDPALITTDELRRAVKQIGRDKSHFYGAEVIGQSSAQEALRL